MDRNDSTTLHPRHDNFEIYFSTKLESLGFFTVDLTYHNYMPEEVKKVIQRRYSSTALYIRSRADRIAIHQEYPIEFQFEVKTHDSKKRNDWTIEALPLIIHQINSMSLGVRCLYVYYNPNNGDEAAFWSGKIPTIRKIFIPFRWKKDNRQDWFEKLITRKFPDIPVTKGRKTRGSGDPFVVIDQSIVKILPKWEELINIDLDHYRRAKENGFYPRHFGGNIFGLSFARQ